jgi:hypothetical protein
MPQEPYNEREAQRQLMAAKRARAADIEIPAVVNPRRRKAAIKSLKKFKSAYFQETCYFKSAPFQIARLAVIEEHIKYGGQRAQAHPRGSAKTTDAVISAVWAVLTGKKKYFLVICASDPKAKNLMGHIRDALEFNDLLLEDFPEVCAPIRALEGAAQRAGKQTFNGKRTRIVYQTDRIVLPYIDGSISCGSVLCCCGITANINGLIIGGKRPDFVLLDDIETPETAASQGEDGQCEKITNIVNSSIGGLVGPGNVMAIVWNGTILEKGCCIEKHTNRKLYPQWRGSRQKAIISWPKRMDLWEKYCEMYVSGISDESDPYFRNATKFYRANRREMDRGSKVAWPSNYARGQSHDGSQMEISALQNLFNQKIKWGDKAFLTQYQNEPPEEEGKSGITPELVASRLNGHPYCVAPEGYDYRLVQFIDVRSTELHYLVLAFSEDGSSAIIDYGIDKVFAPKGDLKSPDSPVRNALEQAVFDALRHRRDRIAGDMNPYKNCDGIQIPIALNAVDARWLPSVVCAFIAESGTLWRAFMGDGKKKGSRMYSHPTKMSKTIIPGDNWYGTKDNRVGVMWHVNADAWKLHSQERFMQDPGTPGAVSLPGVDPRAHISFGKHMCAEEWNLSEQRWDEKSRWNHFKDCHAGACAAGNMCGITIMRAGDPLPKAMIVTKDPFRMPDGRPYLATNR